MRQHIQASVALKTFSGMHFGTARWIQADRIAFATDATFAPGDRAEMRMELSGKYSAVLAELLVVRTYDIDENGEIGCIAQIMDMPDADSERLNNWLSDLTEGGVGAQPSAWLESMIRHQRSSPAATPEETRSALDRINRRLDRSKSYTHSQSRTASQMGRDGRGGRQAIRDVLKASFGEEAAKVGPRLVSTPPAEATAPPAPEASSTATEHVTGGAEGLQCEYDGERITMKWDSKAALKSAWDNGLKVGNIEIPLATTTLEAMQPIAFQFHLPDGQVLALRGRVDATNQSAITCSINVPWGARIKLQSASKP